MRRFRRSPLLPAGAAVVALTSAVGRTLLGRRGGRAARGVPCCCIVRVCDWRRGDLLSLSRPENDAAVVSIDCSVLGQNSSPTNSRPRVEPHHNFKTNPLPTLTMDPKMLMNLAEMDPVMAALIEKEKSRQFRGIELVASEVRRA